MFDPLIFGKDQTERIVAIEPDGATAVIYIEELDGTINTKVVENKRFLMLPRPSQGYSKMAGGLHYQYGRRFKDPDAYWSELRARRQGDHYTAYNAQESLMLTEGYTYFKGAKLSEVSVLSFDIETTSIQHGPDAKVLLISNTYKRGETVVRKLFSYDEHEDQEALIAAWCEWVREINPSVVVGHNIYSFDLPYLNFCSGGELLLGRDESPAVFATKASKFRRDGSQFYEYFRCSIYGREIIDTFFLSFKHDATRKYESYGLKAIIKHECLEVRDRVFYDASTIKDNYKDPVEFELIKRYAERDADDALALYFLMVPAYFYMSQSVPRTFSSMINSATGSQINSLLVRSYLQIGHSIPATSPTAEFQGASSLGKPGLYKNCVRWDVASLYPSIMRQYRVYSPEKDPSANFLNILEFFTLKRLEDKRLYKETGDKYYDDVQSGGKTLINSFYGFMAAKGLNFNYVEGAAFVTKKGREILSQAIQWASGQTYEEWSQDES